MEKIMTTAINTAAKSERELTEAELNHISGGTHKLSEAACKGTIFHEVVLEVWGEGLSLGGAAMMGAISGASGAV
jgi:bacteriocin-like protein